MATALGKIPLQQGRAYRDRLGRIWRIVRVTNAGRDSIGAALPALALASCMAADAAADPDTRYPQWVEAATGKWSTAYTSPLDLIGPA